MVSSEHLHGEGEIRLLRFCEQQVYVCRHDHWSDHLEPVALGEDISRWAMFRKGVCRLARCSHEMQVTAHSTAARDAFVLKHGAGLWRR